MRVGTSISLNLILRKQMLILSEEGFEICCACDDDEWADRLRALGFEVWPIGMRRRPKPIKVLTWSACLYRALKARPVDVVHAHNAFHGIAGRVVARLAGVPVVAQTVHNWWYLEPATSIRGRVYLALERLAGRFCDVVFFINRDDYRRALADGILPEGKCRFIGNGIDIEDFRNRLEAADREAMRAVLGLSPEDVVLVMVARLEPPKDHHLFLEAFRRVRSANQSAKALLVGYGLQEDQIRSEIEEFGLSSDVTLLGYRDDVAELLSASDVLVLASRQEGFGRCLVEAMVARLPVVATNVVGVRDVVRNEETGLLVPYGDIEALANAMHRLIEDRGLVERLTEAAFAEAIERFDERQAALSIAETYRELLAANGCR